MRLPKVSIIIPTYNAQIKLPSCLTSVALQDYPKNKFETLIIDGGSTDNTLSIARLFRSQVIKNPHGDAESGKSIGIQKAKGEIIVLLDSDNVIIKKDWLRKMTTPLTKDTNLFGVESYYYSRGSESLYNKYAMTIHIADPFARILAAKLKIKKRSGYLEHTIPEGGAYPLGANGFLWRKSIIEKVGSYKPKFEESNFTFLANKAGYRKFARIPGYGVYHDYVGSVNEFVKKRIKIGNKFMNRKIENKQTWISGVSKKRFLFAVLYCSTLVGPTIEATYNVYKTKNNAWILHPIMAFISVICYSLIFVKSRLRFV